MKPENWLSSSLNPFLKHEMRKLSTWTKFQMCLRRLRRDQSAHEIDESAKTFADLRTCSIIVQSPPVNLTSEGDC